MALSISKLRADIYKIVDGILETGEAVEISRKGRRLLLILEERVGGSRGRRLSGLKRREGLNCSAQELIDTSWESLWEGEDLS